MKLSLAVKQHLCACLTEDKSEIKSVYWFMDLLQFIWNGWPTV